ncbi:glucuronate isomerase [Panacibacter sp. DH6]|uniref:Uronate isomerase n=1 Tax=Panacibacter microcysteis TaxID=2793269 RepID=A0A931E7W8_9BACT|nr:glucuronate isomerase [Panacibacter microcysteis]MBG9377016.1 glucuronate isomerase [Panacibacter microcysteis]
MKPFLNEDFLLDNTISQELYHNYAKQMPVIDYHCHLPPKEIASDMQFDNLTQVWLAGDHYKWRAMRANGVDESFITGTRTDEEKFMQWAATVPYTMRNPLYHWTHLELQRYFNIHDLLNKESAVKVYHDCNALLQSKAYSVQNLLRSMNVEVVCTTDDPADDLQYHSQIKAQPFGTKVLPAFRPDAAMNIDHANFNAYVDKIAATTNKEIATLDQYVDALKERHDFFATQGCTIADHGLEEIYAEDFTRAEISSIFSKRRSNIATGYAEQRKFKSYMLLLFAEWNHEKQWVQQFHLGALRNNNTRLLKQIGADCGGDSIGDFPQAKTLSTFLNRLESNQKLTKTILYNLNPADNEVFATMIGNFNDGSVAGKVQWGSAWWFLDQKDGMTKQLNTLSNMGLLSRFVGMLTDSRSFLSYPRHEYFRRILCNLFGTEIQKGELPGDIPWIGKMIQDICYHNAKQYFNW